jgi:hypothetical protein
MYRHGGLFSVTSKILINDFLSELPCPFYVAQGVEADIQRETCLSSSSRVWWYSTRKSQLPCASLG